MALTWPYRGRIEVVSWPYIEAVSWPYRDCMEAVSWLYHGRIVVVSRP